MEDGDDMKTARIIQLVYHLLLVALAFALLGCTTRAKDVLPRDDRFDLAYVDEIIRSGKDVLPRLERIADRKHLDDGALHSALSEIARIHFDEGHYQKCLKTCQRFLRRYSPRTHCGVLDKYLLVGDCYRALGNETRARAAYLRVFYHFNDYDYDYSGMRKKLQQRLHLKIRSVKWDGKSYDIPIFQNATEQLVYALQGARVVMTEPDLDSQNLDDPRPSVAGFPRPDTYNIGSVVAAYRAVLQLFPGERELTEKAKGHLREALERHRLLLATLNATIQDESTAQDRRYRSVQWLGRIGGNSVVAPLRRAQSVQFQFSDHDIVNNVMQRLGIEK